MSTHSSSKKLDTTKKKSFSTSSGKKLTKKSQTHKRKSAAVAVTKKVDELHNLQDGPTTSHSFVSDQAILPLGKQKIDSQCSAVEKNAEHKRAVVEMKRLEKKQLEEEKLLKEKENLRLQQLLEKQRLEQSQREERTDTNDDDDDDDSFVKTPKIKCPYVTPGQVSHLASLERLQVLQAGLELSAVEEALNEQATQRDKEVEELLQKAKEAEAVFLAQVEEHERQQRIKEVSE